MRCIRMPSQTFKQRCLRLTIKITIRIYSFCSQRLSPSLKATKGYEIQENFQAQCYELENCSSVVSLLLGELLDITRDKATQSFKSSAATMRTMVVVTNRRTGAFYKYVLSGGSFLLGMLSISFLFNLVADLFISPNSVLVTLIIVIAIAMGTFIPLAASQSKSKIKSLETKKGKKSISQ